MTSIRTETFIYIAAQLGLKALLVTLELNDLGILRPRMLFFRATGIFSKNKKIKLFRENMHPWIFLASETEYSKCVYKQYTS
jgi:hypothetical protein